jgi:hypothetical protein
MLGEYDKNEILRDFPNIELSYEVISHNKVYDAEFILAIPEGKKYFVWFTSFKMQNVCILLEINGENKQIGNVEFGITCFHSHLCYGVGTIVYGTIFRYEGTRFFSIEDIYYYKGKSTHSTSYSNKLLLGKQIFTTDIKQVSYYEGQMVFGIPVIDSSYPNLLNAVGILPYKIKYLQFRYNTQKKIINNLYFKSGEGTNYRNNQQQQVPKVTELIFNVKPEIQNDIYNLYTYNFDTKKCDYLFEVAFVPDYKTSVMLNNLFRNIKENKNLDALEESDDEEEFENDNIDKFVYLEKEYNMVCQYNQKHRKWVPLRLARKGDRVVTKKDLFRLEKNNY